MYQWLIIGCLATIFFSCTAQRLPEYKGYHSSVAERVKITDNFYKSGNNILKKNNQGIWELYTEGDPLERGLANGLLTQELTYYQEKIFTDKIKEFVPSPFYQKILKKFVLFYNRELYKDVPEEYLIELYGISRYASNDFNFIAKPYWRMLYFHAAHDIGHSLQDLALVGCTSFAAWGDKTPDGKLLIGRNFDFYVNDSFNKNKVIAFVNPNKGYKYAIITWPGMIGAVSGMNEKGLTVTINAGKSGIPLKAKTPISFVTKEILQYAKNIEEALQIAKKRKVFVAESILVGSNEDNKAVAIEVSPKKFGVYEAPNSDYLICANHFQSDAYMQDKRNLKQITESHSMYRFKKMEKLVLSTSLLTPAIGADILRSKNGLNDEPIGFGNEKAINQLLSHHGVIFQPDKKIIWISASPYQLGEFVAYDLNKVFTKFPLLTKECDISEPELNIPADPFLYTSSYLKYEEYRKQTRYLVTMFKKDRAVSDEYIKTYLSLNPEYWECYFNVAEYYFNHKNYSKASFYYNLALTKEIPTIPAQTKIQDRIRKCEKKLY